MSKIFVSPSVMSWVWSMHNFHSFLNNEVSVFDPNTWRYKGHVVFRRGYATISHDSSHFWPWRYALQSYEYIFYRNVICCQTWQICCGYKACLLLWEQNWSLQKAWIPFFLVILAKFSASFFPLKTQNINKNHFILCSSINKIMGKTLITTQQARGNHRWEPGVLGGENQSHWNH